MKSIQIFYTRMTTIDNKTIIVPNGILTDNSLTNVTARPERQLDLKVGIAYDADLKKAKGLIETMLLNDKDVIQDEEIKVFVDELADSSVVVNLVDNAIKYTPAGSVIQISAYQKDHQVVVDVADNGPGIPDRAKAQVFEMFYTGQSRIADSHRSLGLGLPLCRAILTAHGGTLTLRDNIPNGSVFSFALPQSEVNIHE